MAEGAAVVNACVVKQAEAAKDLLDGVEADEEEAARAVDGVECCRRDSEI